MDSKLERLEKILYRILEKEDFDSHISEETILISDGDANAMALSSIDYVEFLIDVEKEFSIVYDFDVVFKTIGDLLKYIEEYNKG